MLKDERSLSNNEEMLLPRKQDNMEINKRHLVQASFGKLSQRMFMPHRKTQSIIASYSGALGYCDVTLLDIEI